MSLNAITIDNPVIPKDVSIFIEDGVPYMKYIGTTTLSNGIKVEVECPKMSLVLNGIEHFTEDMFDLFNKSNFMIYKREMFAVENCYFTVQILERTCKKEDIEKELGYKLKFED